MEAAHAVAVQQNLNHEFGRNTIVSIVHNGQSSRSSTRLKRILKSLVSAVSMALFCYPSGRGLFKFQEKHLALFIKVNTG